MWSRDRLTRLLAFLQRMLVIALALLIANFFVTWLLGWRSPHGYGEGLFFAGLSAIAAGLLCILSPGPFTSSMVYHYAHTMMPTAFFGKTDAAQPQANGSGSALMVLAFAGLAVMGLGVVLESIFPSPVFP
jgi:hypothetical protein